MAHLRINGDGHSVLLDSVLYETNSSLVETLTYGNYYMEKYENTQKVTGANIVNPWNGGSNQVNLNQINRLDLYSVLGSQRQYNNYLSYNYIWDNYYDISRKNYAK